MVPKKLPASLGLAISIAATSTLWELLERSLQRMGAAHGVLLLGAAADFGFLEWSLVGAVGGACAIAVAKRRGAALVHIQGWALGAGMLLTHYRLGTAPHPSSKVDLTFVMSTLAGVATLHCCYLCVLAHCAAAMWRYKSASHGH